MIRKILVANRGEIACRVIRTCRALGILTVAVYSHVDAEALHVTMADEAICIGPALARESYLNISAIIAAARVTRADAIHPGYGFLSENAAFAEACADAGVIFIGPPPVAIRAMGGKSAAKALMHKAGVPLIPGYHGDDQSPDFLRRQAESIGWPVLIKASAGGGGKGMRVVESMEAFDSALAGAQREAQASFGDACVLLEKYLVRPRHVEVQVFADREGSCLHLFERDCSIQRRHQKVLEEAPAPGLSSSLREKMGAAAVSAAQAIGYEGAGTVEFLLDENENFYFMEMNTRLQVEHPVTEMITGLDLVELQIRVAEGKPLPFKQKDLQIQGHAFEVRLYAEDPQQGFLPSAGSLLQLSFSDHARIDTGVRSGDRITPYYDPLIAKLIVWGNNRQDALCRLQNALEMTHIAGLKTNLAFLRRLVLHPDFAQGRISTDFIARHHDTLLSVQGHQHPLTVAYAVAGLLQERVGKVVSADPWDHFHSWRLGHQPVESFKFKIGEQDYSVSVENGHVVFPDGRSIAMPHNGHIVRMGEDIFVMYPGHDEVVLWRDPLKLENIDESHAASVTAPIPGRVVAIHVQAGDKIIKGQPLVVIEAMKMEHTIVARKEGRIDTLNVHMSEQVDEKKELVILV